jgi:hypothetical protein
VGRGRPNTCSPNMSQILTMGKAWFSSSASGEFDRARRIGNCRRGRMLGGKASDTHVNVEPELKTWPRVSCRMEKIMREPTWPSPIRILNFIFAGVVPSDPYRLSATRLADNN